MIYTVGNAVGLDHGRCKAQEDVERLLLGQQFKPLCKGSSHCARGGFNVKIARSEQGGRVQVRSVLGPGPGLSPRVEVG